MRKEDWLEKHTEGWLPGAELRPGVFAGTPSASPGAGVQAPDRGVTSVTSQLSPLQVCHLGPVAGVRVRAVAGLRGFHSGPDEITFIDIQTVYCHIARVFLFGLGKENKRGGQRRPLDLRVSCRRVTRRPYFQTLALWCPVLSRRSRQRQPETEREGEKTLCHKEHTDAFGGFLRAGKFLLSTKVLILLMKEE